MSKVQKSTQENMEETKSNLEQPSCPLPLPPRTPWLVFSCLGKKGDRQIFRSVAGGRSCLGQFPEMRGLCCNGSYPGWLFLVDRAASKCSLLGLKSMKKVQLPSPPKWFDSVPSAVLTSTPSKSNCKLICYGGDKSSLAICDLNRGKWTEVKHKLRGPEEILHMVLCGGRLYALTMQLRLAVVDCDEQPVVVRLLEAPSPQMAPHMRHWVSLIASRGELFMVCVYCVGHGQTCYTVEVHKVDWSKMRWERVTSLGDRAFFASAFPSPGMSCCASKAGVAPNSIYLAVVRDPNIYRFDMADRSVSVELPCPPQAGPLLDTGVWVYASVV